MRSHGRRLLLRAIVPAALLYACRGMGPATPLEVGERGTGSAVLIATQGSEYKDAVVRALVDGLRRRSVYVRVADVSALPGIAETDWNVIVVVHTWQMGKPEPHAREFVERVKDRSKLVVLTTSGGGDEKMPGVDAISAASEVARAPADAEALLQRTTQVLDTAPASAVVPDASAAAP